MRVLLDTHVFLWSISDDPRLGPTSRALMGYGCTCLDARG